MLKKIFILLSIHPKPPQQQTNKCFLSAKSAYYTGVIMLKICFTSTGINCISKYIKIANSYFIIFHNFTVFTKKKNIKNLLL